MIHSYYINQFFYVHFPGGVDYIKTPFNVTFSPSKTKHCFRVPLIEDNIYENSKEFFVNLTSGDPLVTLSPHFTVVVVYDDDCK